MIIPVKKVLLFGARKELNHFFERAQEQGIFEFISPSEKKVIHASEKAEWLLSAIKLLKKLPPKTQEHAADPQEIAGKVVRLKGEIEKLSEAIRLVETEILRVAPFGEFSMEDIAYIEREGRQKVQFFCMKTSRSHETHFNDGVVYVGTEYDLDYFIAVSSKRHHYPHMIEMHVERSVNERREQLANLTYHLKTVEREFKDAAVYLDGLKENLCLELDSSHLKQAKEDVTHPLSDHLFSVEAYVPSNKIEYLNPLLMGTAIYAEEIAIEEGEKIPTYMENKGLGKAGEDLVKFYDVPSPKDKDTSWWIVGAFALFFAMIIADAGYGLVYFLLALFLKYKFPSLKGQGARMLKLFMILSVSCIVWGVITSAYFGLRLSPDNPLSTTSFVHYLAEKKAAYHYRMNDDVFHDWAKDFPKLQAGGSGQELLMAAQNTKGHTVKYEMFNEFSNNILLELALLAGIIHITCSLFRYLPRNWAALGWIAFLIGGYLYFPKNLHATTMVNYWFGLDKQMAAAAGFQLLMGGLGFAVIVAPIQKKWSGLGEILTAMQVFADVLSYLRLYALALASAIMAETFNEIGMGIGLVAGGLAILVGHAVNIQLATMSGVIHGLRLNFLEWYHYSFEGGGRLFRPLRKNK
jgi:V/A-type H+-transporting ATPase subunit I